MAQVTSVPTKKKRKSQRQTLKELEEEVIILGMDPKVLEIIQVAGKCPQQIRQRIKILNQWKEDRLAVI